MRKTPALSALLIASAAQAQSFTTDSTVTYSLSWDDVGAGTNHDHNLDAGESALIRLTVSLTNQNATGAFSPPINGHTSGRIAGFNAAFIDFVGGADSLGAWDTSPAHGYGVVPPWNITGSIGNGTPTNGGSNLTQIQFGQFVAFPSDINPTNPITNVYSALWTPSTYDYRYVTFQVAASQAAGNQHSAVLFDLSPSPIAVGVYAPAIFGQVSIPIGIPAPHTAAALLLAAALRRRRR